MALASMSDDTHVLQLRSYVQDEKLINQSLIEVVNTVTARVRLVSFCFYCF